MARNKNTKSKNYDTYVIVISGVEGGYPIGVYSPKKINLRNLKRACDRMMVDREFEHLDIHGFKNGILKRVWSQTYGWEKSDYCSVGQSIKLNSIVKELKRERTKTGKPKIGNQT